MKLLLILVAVFHVTYGGLNDMMLSVMFPPRQVMEMIPPAKAAGEQCSDISLKAAQAGFNKMLSISGDADWNSWQILQDDINVLLNKSVDDGLLKICQARSVFYYSLGAAYQDCISVFHFLQHGQDFNSSWAFVRIFNELEFMCNGGLLQSVQKWDCIRKNRNRAQQSLINCWNEYNAQIQKDPSKICDVSEALMLCFRMPYYLECKEDVSWWSCEQARVALDIDSYCPHLSCSYDTFAPPQTTVASAAVAEMKAYKPPEPVYRTRHELFRSENPGFMRPEKMQLFASLAKKAEERAKRKKRSVEDKE